MNKNKILLSVVGSVSLIASIIGWINYAQGMAVFSVITWPIIWLGLFVWGDAMILGAFLFIASVVLWFKNNHILTGLFLSVYFTLRSFIEAMYNLNAQFSSVTRPWEAYTVDLAKQLHFAPQEMFVVPQIIYTAICVTSFIIFIVYLKQYMLSDIVIKKVASRK